jgi:hypothetical protein
MDSRLDGFSKKSSFCRDHAGQKGDSKLTQKFTVQLSEPSALNPFSNIIDLTNLKISSVAIEPFERK